MHTMWAAALHQHMYQHQHQKLPRSHAKNNKTSMWDTMVVTGFRFTVKLLSEQEIHFEKVLNEDGMRSLIPVFLEKDALNFYLNREVMSEKIHSVKRRRAVS